MTIEKHFDISIGQSSVDSSIKIDGEDVSALVRGVMIDCRAGSLTNVTIEAVSGSAHAHLAKTLEIEHVALTCRCSDVERTLIESRVRLLESVLRSLKVPCACDDGAPSRVEGSCNCGATRRNAAIDQVLP